MNNLIVKTLTSKDQDKVLDPLLNSQVNPIMCSLYAGGGHCDNPVRNTKKIDLWGPRGDKEEVGVNLCKVTKYYETDKKVIGYFNIGDTAATVKDVINKGSVYEFSGFFISDKYLEVENEKVIKVNKEITDATQKFLSECTNGEGANYTKAFVTFVPTNYMNYEFFKSIGAQEINCHNYKDILGENSINADRLQCKEGEEHFYEGGIEKVAMIMPVNEHIYTPHDEI